MGGVNGLGHMMDLHMYEGNERRLLEDEGEKKTLSDFVGTEGSLAHQFHGLT